MDFDTEIITASNIRYLIALDKLNEEGKGIKCVDVANALGFSKPSIYNMMKALYDMGFVAKIDRGFIFLTEKGKLFAAKYRSYFNIANNFFEITLGLSPEEAKNSSYFILSEIVQPQLENMCLRMKTVLMQT